MAMLRGPQRFTCLAGGTRSGKTFLIVREIIQRAKDTPDSCHALLRFRGNAAKASLSGQTIPRVEALCFPGVDLAYLKTEDTWNLKNGAKLIVGGLDDDYRVEKILGREFSTIFLNEASQIPYESALIAFTRLAEVSDEIDQKLFVDLNPTNKLHWTYRMFVERRDPVTRLPLAAPEDYALQFLNPHDNAQNLTAAYLKSLDRLPERQRRRFYEGVYVDAVDDALWTYDLIDRTRAQPAAIPPDKRKIVIVGVDPAGGGEGHDETGIVVAALGEDGHAYILADRSSDEGAKVWPRRAVTAYREFRADCIVAETNYGGDMVAATIRAEDANVPIHTVTASRGKAVRAEPIALRYDKGEVHHVGRFPELEEQLCAFSTFGYAGAASPDRADAAIWALTALFERAGREPGMLGFLKGLAEGSAVSSRGGEAAPGTQERDAEPGPATS